MPRTVVKRIGEKFLHHAAHDAAVALVHPIRVEGNSGRSGREENFGGLNPERGRLISDISRRRGLRAVFAGNRPGFLFCGEGADCNCEQKNE